MQAACKLHEILLRLCKNSGNKIYTHFTSPPYPTWAGCVRIKRVASHSTHSIPEWPLLQIGCQIFSRLIKFVPLHVSTQAMFDHVSLQLV